MEAESGMENMEKLKGKNILVTGGTGFVGSHLVEELLKTGAHVVVPYRSADPSSYFATQGLRQHTVLVYDDLKDFDRTFEIVTKYEIDYIFHLAAQAIVPTAYINPRETIMSNVIGTTNILEAARLYSGIKGIIVASSDKAYGKSKKAYKETDPLRGDHPYEVSKSAADLIAYSYFKTYKLPVVITRFGNIYGPGDLNFNRIIPGIIKTLITGNTLIVRSDGTYKRDYVYVKDVVSAYIFLLRHLEKIKGESFNISYGYSISVGSLIRSAEKVFKKKIHFKISDSAINEIAYQHLDYSKIKKLGWAPSYRLPSSLRETYAWYLQYVEKIF
jgi:CDP-glucose 4,6-dehydratase